MLTNREEQEKYFHQLNLRNLTESWQLQSAHQARLNAFKFEGNGAVETNRGEPRRQVRRKKFRDEIDHV